ncbi:hypothetical protein J7E88_08965 [Streptomyces sp. ISL-10]|uniref:hypothetical protein n=1 Tax=Streptomyces sp. ISL-10 TaxID=2819172 RepID=UPI001BE4E65F|nr:hypothetical protein [Streptomyces sp. ISL-10]MBT2365445.1 hypothetical protein [Streptomyces sp. ISL-10]
MAGAEEAGDDDALYVLTAVLLTPAQFPSVLGDDYPAACRALALEPFEEGYGLVLGQDGEGARWTVVVDDVSLVAVAIASWDCGMEYDLSPDERSMVAALPGWPLAVAVAAPNLPAPHDPAPEEGDPTPLAPPDTGRWGPAQRRLGADEVALQWAQWRDRTGLDGPDADGTDTGRATGSGEVPAGTRSGGLSEGVRRALGEARAYTESAPPPGRVRSSFAPGGARMIRADGPGWSMVARTDDIAFLLLDEEPGEVIPVGRGPELPGLLEALEKVAVHPA